MPMAGDVGSQYTPAAGWAQALEYRREVLKEKKYENAIAVVLGGEGSVATNGFWSSLTIATTLNLPMLFYIEDNRYAISVPGDKQTPGGNIAENLRSFRSLHIIEGDGSDPAEASAKLKEAVEHVRFGNGAALIRLTVPRLSGHSGQDTQAYKPRELIEAEKANDPLFKLRDYLLPEYLSEDEWKELEKNAQAEVKKALEGALNRPEPDPESVARYLFAETKPDGSPDRQIMGGLAAEGHQFPLTC
jgi:2-oxoisovalerate dehydrogenase E1 component